MLLPDLGGVIGDDADALAGRKPACKQRNELQAGKSNRDGDMRGDSALEQRRESAIRDDRRNALFRQPKGRRFFPSSNTAAIFGAARA